MFGNNGMQFAPQDWQQMALTAGLSMLGNNDGTRSVGQLIGQGGLDALAGLQARKQYEQAMARQQMLDEREQAQHDMQMQKGQFEMAEAQKKAELMKRWQAGDQSVYQYLFPEQWAADQRQARAQKNALELEKEKQKAKEAEAQKERKLLESLGILPGTLPLNTAPVTTSPAPAIAGGQPAVVPATKRNIMDLTPEEQVALAASGKTGKTIVETINKAKENAPNKAWLEAASKTFSKVYEGARSAAVKSKDTLDNVDTLLGTLDKGLYTGTGGEFAQEARRFAASLGFGEFKDTASAGEVFDSIAKGMALEKRDPATGAGMPGALSDADREYLTSMVPNLGKTVEGNRLLLQMIGRMAQRKIEYYDLMNEYIAQNGQLDAGFDKQMKNHKWADLFADLPRATRKPLVTEKPGTHRGASQVQTLDNIWGQK